jgi:type VI secretion system protein ImpC
MAKGLSFGSMFVGNAAAAEAAAQKAEAEQESDSPMRILIVGDFGGTAVRSGAPRPMAVDRDNLDEVLARLHPAARLDGVHPDSSAVEIEFSELDDFHPDRLYERLPLFDTLRETRDRLESPTTFAAAAAEVHGWAEAQTIRPAAASPIEPSAESGKPAPVEPPKPPVSGENLLDQMIEHSGSSSPEHLGARRSSVFDLLLDKVAGPYRIAADDPDKQPLLDLVDALTADRLRAILHHPAFQALESAWRSLDFLVRRIETDANLKLFVLDMPKGALAGELDAVAELRSSSLCKLLADLPAGSPPWTLVVGNYQFAATRADIEMLGWIAQIAAHAGAPFVAGADPAVFGCPSPAERPDPDDWQEPDDAAAQMWRQLRHLPAATSLGLVAPRFLLRHPYGLDASPTERLEFVELPTPQHDGLHHDGFLWGNSAFVAACLLAQAFSRNGWNLTEDMGHDIDDLPLHVYDDDGQSALKPCAEALLGDRAVERILDFGIMPIQSFAGRGTVRLARLQSLSDPPSALAGRWS